jgi:raffinose/stachyose/melibiose transport system substrate-binding protein
MRRLKTIAAAGIAVIIGLGGLSACGGSTASSDKGHVYFLNGKPEVVDQLKQLAEDYTKKTGVQVDIQTAASGSYESTLTSELSKSNAPTMFTVAGYDEFAKYKQYLKPIQDTDVYKLMSAEGKANAHQDADGTYTMPYAAEWYGIIYNKKIIKDYASKSYALIKSDADITDYATLKKVAEDIQKHKDDLGIKAAFATPGLDSSGSYRFAAHMTRIPLFYEFKDANSTFEETIKGTYLKNYKDLFDLEMKNSPTQATLLSSKSYDDVTAEFALGDVAFYPNGIWAYTQIKDHNVADDDLGMLPYYMGIKGEENYGPASVYDASWAINSKADEKDQQASLDFIKWMVSSEEGKKTLSKEMGLSVPFTTFTDEYQPSNPLLTAARAYEKAGKQDVRSFPLPSPQWQEDLTSALTEYAQGTGKWDAFTSTFTKEWKSEWANNKSELGLLPESQKFN